MSELKFFEYGGYLDPTGKETDDLATSSLSPENIRYLHALSDTLVPGKKIFEIGSSFIRAKSMVGTISFDGVHIEILPKLLRAQGKDGEGNTVSILKNLMFMLSYTNALELSESEVGPLAQDCDSFIEAYISIFASRLSQHLIRFGIPRRYVDRSENLTTVRGKISFSKQIKINNCDQSRVFCDFSDFIEDNMLSRAFKYVSYALAKLTSSSPTLALLNRCLGLLDGVQNEYVDPSSLDRVAIEKRNPNLLALINLTKMFLKRLRPDFSGYRNNKVFAILFDMSELFEQFIFQILKRNEQMLNISVVAQSRKRLVSSEKDYLGSGQWSDRSLFDTYSDIVVRHDCGASFIIDTKYKIVDSTKNHYGIGNQDAYQVLAYKQINKTESGEPSVVLLYPMASEEIQKEFRVTGSHNTFFAWTINVSVDLKANLPFLLKELLTLIEVAAVRR